MSQSATSTKTILLVEDDNEIARLLGMLLRSEGFDFAHVDRGDQAVEAVREQMPNVVILDVMLPGMNGVDVCSAIRAFYPGMVLMLTACDDDITEISSLNIGADDYLTKPVRPHVLLARLRSLLRRVPTNPVKDGRFIRCGDLVIDQHNYRVTLENESIELTAAEFELLVFLAKRQGQIVSRDECFLSLRGIEYDGLDRSIDMRFSTLRRKLKSKTGATEVIKTIRGKGYLLMAET